jgi:hypothetical protein
MNHLRKIKQAFFQLHPLSENEWTDFSDKLLLKSFRKGQFLIRAGQVENGRN